MTGEPAARSFVVTYRAALAAFLDEGGEEALERAYGLGRLAVQEGLGILDVLACHEEAVRGLARNADRRDRAAAFLRECLSPFEMSLRGYRDTVEALQQANRELVARTEELEAFSYSAAHDLRAPLRAILGFSQLLADAHAETLGPEGLATLERVRAAARRMDLLISALLELARVTRAVLQEQEVDVSQVAGEIAAALRERDGRRAVRLDVQPGLRARADPMLLRILLENLLDNAWKFTSRCASPEIRVLGHREGDWLVCRVEDNGAGFDPSGAHLLFRPFQRLHGPREYEGTGIGLATVARIVQRHGGTIRAEGRPGEGATFRFELPAARK